VSTSTAGGLTIGGRMSPVVGCQLSVAGGLLAISRNLGSVRGGPRPVRRRALSITSRSKDDLRTGDRALGREAGSQASELGVMLIGLAVARLDRPIALRRRDAARSRSRAIASLPSAVSCRWSAVSWRACPVRSRASG
jgi:hypothetical protein